MPKILWLRLLLAPLRSDSIHPIQNHSIELKWSQYFFYIFFSDSTEYWIRDLNRSGFCLFFSFIFCICLAPACMFNSQTSQLDSLVSRGVSFSFLNSFTTWIGNRMKLWFRNNAVITICYLTIHCPTFYKLKTFFFFPHINLPYWSSYSVFIPLFFALQCTGITTGVHYSFSLPFEIFLSIPSFSVSFADYGRLLLKWQITVAYTNTMK